MRFARVAAAAVAGVALLAGCSEGQQANETLPSTSSTAAPSSDALQPLGPPEFPVPDAAREQTPSGVAAFAAYYLDLSDFLLPSLDSQPLRELSRQCEVCDQLADGYDADRAAGYRYEGGGLTVTSTGTATVEGTHGELSFVLRQEPVAVYDANGDEIVERRSDSYELTGGMTLDWDSTRTCWIVTQLVAERLL
ncbi:DUF6318 family protein [Modestobacter sp. I12A-02662]|uniref:DUF6318 family protein n=1 Tax=Modestobacter sp. I12A-02662 TaxID=1730496 RepID=UPI0034E045A7